MRCSGWNKEEDALRQILAGHMARYPRLEVRDLYKLVYQGAMGSEHAASDVAQARNRLEQEIKALGEGPVEPVVDPISANGRVVRISLRPYVAKGGDLAALLAAFIQTADEFEGSETRLRQYWTYAERMAREGMSGFAVGELQGFFAEMEAQGFPAVHHSTGYKRAYRPAYRVIVYEFLARE
jgi:hypothetical protein